MGVRAQADGLRPKAALAPPRGQKKAPPRGPKAPPRGPMLLDMPPVDPYLASMHAAHGDSPMFPTYGYFRSFPGFVFKTGACGLGYYLDVSPWARVLAPNFEERLKQHDQMSELVRRAPPQLREARALKVMCPIWS